jgi:hypothetical protein
MDSYMMIAGFLVLAVLLSLTGFWMLVGPRRFAAVCEAFVVAGNLPSFLPKSVKTALLEIRAFGFLSLTLGVMLAGATVDMAPALLHATESGARLYWLAVPAALGLSAGYVILFYASEWVAKTFEKWLEHPLVPQDLVYALTWELRIAGFAFTLFGLGAMSLWLRFLLS